MDPVNLMITACLLSDPAICEEKAVPVAEAVSIRQCYAWAQPFLAQWAGNHPKYHIVKWRCGEPGKDGKDI
ncbi:hypothetical protein [Oryzibacter oryziterrae]|uniref:hypothetical protein n=1 Tax=Oryzibacter oryziterrae TaxID=2766474 RepID=UPI001F4376A0|nr:hypothetical protein [Oryzibacter oryziterrae]